MAMSISFHPVQCRLGTCRFLVLVSLFACGSSEGTGPGTANAAPVDTAQPEVNPAPVSPPPSAGAVTPSASDESDAAESPPSIDPMTIALVCESTASGADFVASCTACAGDDVCASCLCTECTDVVEACTLTEGCLDILACVKTSGCSGIECYCGDSGVIDCSSGEANGVCKDVILGAPAGKPPTTADPSGGPASDRAVAVARCMERNDRCSAACGLEDD
jgi:hypothetical protein